MSRQRVFYVIATVLIALTSVGVLGYIAVRALGESNRCRRTFPQSADELEVAARPVLDALEHFRSLHGKYPARLADAGVDEQSRYGPWQYQGGPFGGMFTLQLGDYRTCMWQVTYSSDTGRWYYDM
jgi:hypothetical protein